MSEIIIVSYLLSATLYIVFTLYFADKYSLSFLNPNRNYNKWIKINWFGIIVITLILNIIFIPYAILYWIWKMIHFLFTVGRE